MDILSDAVAAMRLGTPHSNRTVHRAPWSTYFPAAGNSAGFHVVLQGSCWLLPDYGDPIHLQVGDVAFAPRSRGHALSDSPTGTSRAETPRPAEMSSAADTSNAANTSNAADAWSADTAWSADAAGPETVLLCGAYLLDDSRPHPALVELPDVIHLPARVGHSPLRAAIDLLGHELDTRDGSGAIAPLLEVLLLFMVRTWYEAHPAESGWVAALRDPAVHAALQAMHAQPAAPWTVAALAAQAGVSRSVFAQRFTATTGTGPLNYLTWWRMTRAARMLRESDVLLRVVAEQCGYSSEFAFAKAFKREFGIAPGQFRLRADAA
ncbi:AraC family transcriptional regulator [Nocardia sp. NPDC059240]|uniref:AraC family transcriptional regulator n=1 Tax=Nocardia sp. NPDC059240 TaxID=3346786 RepID=UPI0036CC4D9A